MRWNALRPVAHAATAVEHPSRSGFRQLRGTNHPRNQGIKLRIGTPALNRSKDGESNEFMNKALWFLCLAWVVGYTAEAQDNDTVAMLTQELKAHSPPQWQIRVRWQD